MKKKYMVSNHPLLQGVDADTLKKAVSNSFASKTWYSREEARNRIFISLLKFFELRKLMQNPAVVSLEMWQREGIIRRHYHEPKVLKNEQA